MTDVRFAILCKLCGAGVQPDQTAVHMADVHGFQLNFLLKNNINGYYTAMPVLDDWPKIEQPQHKRH